MNAVRTTPSGAGGPIFAAGLGRGRAVAVAGPSAGWMPVLGVFLCLAGGAIPVFGVHLVMTGLRPVQGRFEDIAGFAAAAKLLTGTAALLDGGRADQ